MMRHQGLDPPPRAAHRARLSASFLLVALISASASRPAADPPLDEELKRSMAVIADAFRGGKPALLTSIMPEGSKVLVSLENFEGSPGYYGRDQVYYILQKMFSDLKTRRFDVRPQSGAAPPPKGQKATQIAHCVGNWRYTRQDGPETETQMLFVLSQKNARWSLVQIREAR